MKIANIEAGKLVLAPMEGVTDSAFRMLCRKHGANLCYTEMANVLSVNNGLEIKRHERDIPLVVQLSGNNPQEFIEASKRVSIGEILDVNLGCPSNRTLEHDLGSALLKKPRLVYDIIESLVAHTPKPVTAKMRIGFSDSSKFLETIKLIEKAGVSAIAIHGRTTEQGYSGKADWGFVKKAKEILSIPVIGNGDISSVRKAKQRMEETNCDAVMIGRAAIGNPLIFSGPSSLNERIDAFHEYIDLAKQLNCSSVSKTKLFLQHALNGEVGASKKRHQIHSIKSLDELSEFANSLKN